MIVFEGIEITAIPKGFEITTSDVCYLNVMEFSISILQKNSIFSPSKTSILSCNKSSTLTV